MIDNTLMMRITREDKHYHLKEMKLKDIIHNYIVATLGEDPDDIVTQEVKE